MYEGIPFLDVLSGEELCGIVIVLQKPRMADVRIREVSSASRSCGMSRERNCTRGLIINEFHRNTSSKLSISKELEFIGLLRISLVAAMENGLSHTPVLHSVGDVKVCTVVKRSIAKEGAQLMAGMLYWHIPPAQPLVIGG